jgi:phosphatidylserine/phosphatidylglycerophosphate/cardiolipin synthase-like enzyme
MTHIARRTGFALVAGSMAVLVTYTAILSKPELRSSPGTQHATRNTSPVLISAVYFDTYVSGEPDEAVQLWNVSAGRVDLSGWQITDNEATVIFPPGTGLAYGRYLWCTKTAANFTREFGFSPDYEYGGNSDPNVPDMTGRAPTFANSGDEVVLQGPAGQVMDALVYEGGDTGQAGWRGPAVEPQPHFGQEGQVLYRKLDQVTGQPVADTDTAADWAQDPTDPIEGRRVRYPGWDLETFWQPASVTEPAHLTVAVAPDNAFDTLIELINRAAVSLDVVGYTFEHPRLAEAVADRARRGVVVRVLLEGDPAGGIQDSERWAAQQIEAAGGQVTFMIGRRRGTHARYAGMHAKFMLIDRRELVVSSENWAPGAFADDDKSDGTLGRRGFLLDTDAPTIVARAQAVFEADLDPAHHRDLFRWTAGDPEYGAPPPGYVPITTTNGTFYRVVAPAPLVVTGTLPLELVQAPEHSLRTRDSLLGLLARAGPGDRVLVEQLYERLCWGDAGCTPQDDPNPRLAACLAAARRGATVRLLLDRRFDDPSDPRSNGAAAATLNALAAAEGLDLEVRLGNPTGDGLHSKLVLVQAGGQGWVHVGSLNGSEVSSKANRELALQVRSDAAFDYLRRVFEYDWAVSQPRAFLPFLAAP